MDIAQTLENKVAQLKNKKDELVIEVSKAPKDLEEMDLKLEKLNSEITQNQERSKNSNLALISNKQEFDQQEFKYAQSMDQSDLYLQIVEFEKLCKKVQIKLNELQNQQLKSQAKIKDTQVDYKQLACEIGNQSEDLEQEVNQAVSKLSLQVNDVNELKDDFRLIQTKISNKNHNELKKDQVLNNYEKLQSVFEKVSNQMIKQSEFELDQDLLSGKFNDHKRSNLKRLSNENQELQSTNQSLIKALQNQIQQLKTNHTQTQDQMLINLQLNSDEELKFQQNVMGRLSFFHSSIQQLQNKLNLEKFKLEGLQTKQSKSSADSNISIMMYISKFLVDQHERLSQLQTKDFEQLVQQLGKLQDDIKDCEKLFQENKLKNKQRDLSQLSDKIGQNENFIESLLERIDALKMELDKINSDKSDLAKQDLQSQLKSLNNMLDDCIESNNKLKNKLEGYMKLDEDSLRDQDLSKIGEDIGDLKDQQLKKIDHKLYDLEKMLKKEINDQRNTKQKEYQDKQKLNKLNLEKLVDNFTKIQDHISTLEQNVDNLKKQYEYKDLERGNECENNLKPQIEKQLENYQIIQQQVNDINKKLKALDQKQNEISHSAKENANLNDNNDIIVQQWQDLIDQSKDLGQQIERISQDQNNQIKDLDEISGKILEAIDKFSFKDKLLKKCRDSQQQKQNQIEKLLEDLAQSQKETEQSQEQLGKVIMPINNPNFQSDFKDKQDKIAQNHKKTESQKHQIQGFQDKLTLICKDLNFLPDKLLITKDLQGILDELERFDIELQYETEEIKAHKNDVNRDAIDIQQLIDLNLNLKTDECDNGLKRLNLKVSELDDKIKEAEIKLEEYIQKIKDGIRDNIQNEDVVAELKQLRQQAEKIDEELRSLERKKNYMKAQSKVLRERVNEINKNGTDIEQPIKELHDLANKINSFNIDCNGISDELTNKSDDLDSRILQLEQFLQKHSQIQNLQKEYNDILGDINKSLNQVSKRNDTISDLHTLLKNVLAEMEKGTDSDYKLKENFIRNNIETIQDIEDQIFSMDEQRQSISAALFQMRQDQQKDSQQAIDPDVLQQQITDAMELLDKLEQQDQQSQQCQQDLNQMHIEIGDADTKELIQLRQKEYSEFIQKLKKLEVDYLEIKKQTSQGSPSKEVSQEMQQIDKLLKNLKDEKTGIQKVLGNELELYLNAPQKLENLTTLSNVIGNIRELGLKLNSYIEQLDEATLNGAKLSRKIGGLDIAKRLRNLKDREEDQSMRLETLKKRFEFIGKGAQDCDGYTSNTEEATFIDTLLAELPEMINKLHDSQDECVQIQSQVYDMKKEVEKQDEQNERWQKYILDNLNNIEDNVDLNEKSVVFLEKLAEKLEDHFLSMDVKKKLDKRQLELTELQNICEDFSEKLLDMQEHLIQDIEKIDNKAKIQNPLQDILVDEHGNPVNLLEELIQVSDELKYILDNVSQLQDQNEQIRQKRDEAQEDFNEKVLVNSPYSKYSGKITEKKDVFTLLKSNGMMKKKIIDMIKQLKEVSKKLRDNKVRYQDVRNKLEKQAPRKLYKAVKGDMVDELFADYINKLNCPVPIKRLGNNQYKFGTKKIFAKIINGKLVIRVGGGYMGIEEFMMYYGQQELQKIQKEEMMNMNAEEVEDETRRLSIGRGLLGDNFITQNTEEDEEGYSRRSKISADVNIEQLKQKLKDQSGRKKKRDGSHTMEDEIEENKFGDNGANTIVGIGDVRKALKKNVFEIKTYEEGKSPVKASKKTVSGNNVEKELKSIERRVGNKLKQNLETKMSPSRRPKTDSQHSEVFQPATDRQQTQDSTNQTRTKFVSKIPQIKK